MIPGFNRWVRTLAISTLAAGAFAVAACNSSSNSGTTVATPTGAKSYDVDWMVTGAAGKEKFLDVVIDGISTSLLTQQDYASVLGSTNGDLDALTTALKAKGL